MALIPRGPGPPVWALCVSLVLLLVVVNNAAAEKSKNYYMQHLCKTHFLQQLYRKIDGAVLHSQNERNLDCVITFQTHSILQRFMLRFDLLQLDCNDHLFIYDGAHAVGSYKSDLSCRNTKQTVGNIYTRTNFVTLKYVTDGWGTESNGFKLVITAFKDKKHACEDFRCNSEFCIDTGLVCDEVNHCGDGSDEASSAICTPNDMTTVLGVSSMVFVVVIVSGLMVMCAGVIGLAICVCRRGNGRPQQNAQQQNANYPCSLSPDLCALGPVQQMYGSNNGNGKQAGQQSGGLPPSGADYSLGGQTYVMAPPQTITRGAGNWLHPAGVKLGYSVDWRRLFCLAK